MAKEKYYLEVKEAEGKRFYYKDFGSESHGRTSFRLWVHPSFVQKDEKGKPFFELPTKGHLEQGKSSYTVILRRGEKWIYDVGIRCGYRGGSSFEILNDPNAKVFKYYEYRSPRGSLGISTYALVESDQDSNSIEKEAGVEEEERAFQEKRGDD